MSLKVLPAHYSFGAPQIKHSLKPSSANVEVNINLPCDIFSCFVFGTTRDPWVIFFVVFLSPCRHLAGTNFMVQVPESVSREGSLPCPQKLVTFHYSESDETNVYPPPLFPYIHLMLSSNQLLDLPLRLSNKNVVRFSHNRHAIYMFLPSQLVVIILIMYWVKSKNYGAPRCANFSPSCRHFSSLGFSVLLNTFSLCSPLKPSFTPVKNHGFFCFIHYVFRE